jgi:NAD-dependent DNA ligase
LIRSGDVSPHIRKVTTPAEEAKMPTTPYKWNDTHVDVLLEDINSDETVKEKVITGFFRGIGVEGLSSGNIARIIDAGFDSVPKIINMTTQDFLTVDGFKDKTANKLYNGIKEKLESASVISIMSASNIFGRGFSGKKTELIMEAYPDVLISKEPAQEKINKVASIKGMAKKTAEAFVQAIPNFIQFLQETNLTHKIAQAQAQEVEEKDQSHPLFGKTIVMTGFRDAAIQQALKDVGAKLGSSVSKNTFLVLVKDLEEDTGKAADAKKLGIKLMTPEEFKAQYL